MEVLEVTPKDYLKIINNPYFVYGSAEFNELNKQKCDQRFFLLFRKGKYRLGIIAGSSRQTLLSPFSAPFGGFTFISEDVRLQYLEEALKLFLLWAEKKELISINLTLPPSIYGNSFITKQLNCLWRYGFQISGIELNYSFDLNDFDERYQERIWHNARKNLKISLNAGLQFIKCEEDNRKVLAYEIIVKNRENRGYPLRMSWDQVAETVSFVPADFFIVYNNDNQPVASAIVFHVNKSVVQVIYWGDFPGYSELKPMNFISFEVFNYYKKSGKKIVDLGPSSEHSMPNHGLCEFKESIGCRIDPKFTLIHTL